MIDNETRQYLLTVWREHRGTIIGGTAGFLIAVLILVIGFFYTLFIAFCVGIGLFIGNEVDKGESKVKDLLNEFQARFGRDLNDYYYDERTKHNL